MADKKVAEQYYAPPPKLGKWEGFRTFLWNSETSQCLGRTGSSWALLTFSYEAYHPDLSRASVRWLCNRRSQRRRAEPDLQSRLGFRPTPPEYGNVESRLIWYKASDNGNVGIWTKLIDEYLKPYSQPEDNRVDCSFKNPPPEGKVCKVPLDELGRCTKENQYSFKAKKPCIFLKLNKIFNWVPDVYNTSTNLPEKMPQDLKDHIKTKEVSKETDMVWVSCGGENPADNEHIGAIQYYPRRGFPAYYFPYKNIDGYLPPVVAVYFEEPKSKYM
ncbi:AGAP009595-PA-like protein [Anopheles sinensis]|uniref:AGAP009595-PA-like protein n=1 Tax=Anopheles sinensis TaxID=74873 RepID=A0A084VBY2_ANOSI|nr:AGAP009595-PA-like protein [Anopheles sinensis]